METKQIITFHYSKDCKRPRSVDSSCNLLRLYAPEEITFSGDELEHVDLQTKVFLPPNMSSRIWLLPSFEKNRLYMQNIDMGMAKNETVKSKNFEKNYHSERRQARLSVCIKYCWKKNDDVNDIKS